MPVHGMNVGKGPGNTADVEAISYVGIFVDVTRVIVVNEVVSKRLTKDNRGKHCETDANADRQAAATDFRTACRLSSALVHASNLLRCTNLGEINEGQVAN